MAYRGGGVLAIILINMINKNTYHYSHLLAVSIILNSQYRSPLLLNYIQYVFFLL